MPLVPASASGDLPPIVRPLTSVAPLMSTTLRVFWANGSKAPSRSSMRNFVSDSAVISLFAAPVLAGLSSRYRYCLVRLVRRSTVTMRVGATFPALVLPRSGCCSADCMMPTRVEPSGVTVRPSMPLFFARKASSAYRYPTTLWDALSWLFRYGVSLPSS